MECKVIVKNLFYSIIINKIIIINYQRFSKELIKIKKDITRYNIFPQENYNCYHKKKLEKSSLDYIYNMNE